MDNTKTIGEIVALNYQTAAVFQTYGIDFCCGGGKSLATVCEEKQLSQQELIAKLKKVISSGSLCDYQLDWSAWSSKLLIHYIQEIHHVYVRNRIPLILQYAAKVAKVHQKTISTCQELFLLVQHLANELREHLRKEEEILFPAIESLGNSPTGRKELERLITEVEVEHDWVGCTMRRIRQITDDYTPPDFACQTVKVLYQYLEEFEADLHRHVHLENNVLIPRVK